MINRETTHISKPAPPPISLDHGRLDIARIALSGSFTLGSLVCSFFFLWLASRNWGGSALLVVFALLLSIVCLVFAGVVMRVSLLEISDHRSRVADWHAAALEAYSESGQEVVQHMSETALSPSKVGDALLLAIYVHMRLSEGAVTPWARRNLSGALFIADRRAGDVSDIAAREFADTFARMGLIVGRSERSAGEWAPRSADEVVSLVSRNWSKTTR